ncbi:MULTISPECIES: hypothetical protein [unclassified Novosphingobium]|uniref:hypothetical protein n=1 Tax=unclassified Novosphingobium TaxID=2644732 RepID=UPI000D318AD1|nr:MULTISPECIES: hypothetical protein [unclassified Novosphingobium]PTR08676.1 hypothetical protein C8K11_111122 [Novosphingobium sp. GV055]PUB01399.1 hypothetical protein C8K12_111122 [Novosphingobium sp. GV061]PUB16973.1 hypothetical protein C8K14_111122 [Novosphingobium sp. GV079]PUB39996.1 hypothetical protein C8K10_111122 [Novosphingobium sp. GV027]
MPQDIPLEASETLAFTPQSLAGISGAPVFTLRTPTTREKRFRRRLMAEEGVAFHSEGELRQEILDALRTHLWGEEKFVTHRAPLLAYWDALDEYRLQKKDDPDLKWSYDEATEQAVLNLLRDVEQSWKPIGRMKADNIDHNEIFMAATVAVIVQEWSGLPTARDTDRGYLTIDCVDAMATSMTKFAERNDVLGKLAWLELFNACAKQMSLDEEEEKNSASPSPSGMTPPASKPRKASAKAGKSRASARSSKTPAGA